ncbi:hypothetical protein ABPG77_001702 [Micractinium sp. CCAP 211/92]
MISRKAPQEDAGSEHPGSPDAKRPRLDTTNSMTHGSDLTAQQQGRSPGVKAVRETAAAPATHPSTMLGRHGMVDRTQYVRLLEQALSALGFADVAAQLEHASGIASQPAQVNKLQRAVLTGDWATATQQLGLLDVCSSHALQEAKFVILEQAYTEALRAGDSAAALACLREQLAPLGVHPERLHMLAARLMGSECGSGKHDSGGSGGSSAAAEERADGDAPVAEARRRVLRRLQAVIPAEVMLPERRLEELVEQALLAQIDASRFHNTPGVCPSLLRNYDCGMEQIPSCTTQVLLDHTDEVWHLQFSHDGSMLASCGKDQTAILWEVQRSSDGAGGEGGSVDNRPGRGGGSEQPAAAAAGRRDAAVRPPRVPSTVVKRHVLRGHRGPIAFLSWSPDDRTLATCGQDALRLWDTATGRCLAVFLHHKEPVACAAWFPDGRRLVTGGHDKQLCIVNLDGTVERQWRIQRVQEVLVAKGGRYILATTCERKVRVYDLQSDTEAHIPEVEPLISMSLSQDGRYLLVNLTSNSMHLWDCGPDPSELRMPAMPAAVYRGPGEKQSRFVVRSCLGGLNERFVLTGSEECRVYVYHRQSGQRLLSLEGHSGTVNSVAWNPADPHMFASASDDKSIHIWQTPPAAAAAASDEGDGSDALPRLEGGATQ